MVFAERVATLQPSQSLKGECILSLPGYLHLRSHNLQGKQFQECLVQMRRIGSSLEELRRCPVYCDLETASQLTQSIQNTNFLKAISFARAKRRTVK